MCASAPVRRVRSLSQNAGLRTCGTATNMPTSSLPRERRFYFRPIDGKVIAAAGTMDDFCTAVGHLDPRALQYHLERGDFSRWLDDTIADKELAAQVAAWEDELLAHRAADLERIRRQLVEAVGGCPEFRGTSVAVR